jgi:hypothetical protein
MSFLNGNCLNSRVLEKNRVRSIFFFFGEFSQPGEKKCERFKGFCFFEKMGASPHIMREKKW